MLVLVHACRDRDYRFPLACSAAWQIFAATSLPPNAATQAWARLLLIEPSLLAWFCTWSESKALPTTGALGLAEELVARPGPILHALEANSDVGSLCFSHERVGEGLDAAADARLGDLQALASALLGVAELGRESFSHEDRANFPLLHAAKLIGGDAVSYVDGLGSTEEGSQSDAMAQDIAGVLAVRDRLVVATKLESEFEVQLQTEKLASMRELAYGASHEVNNPLANISSRAQTLLRDETDPERRRKLSAINRQAFRAFEMIANMMHFAKPPTLNAQETKLEPALARLAADFRDECEEHSVAFDLDVSNVPAVTYLDWGHVEVALRAMMRNAIESLVCGGQIELTAEVVSHDGKESLGLIVCDDGPGISEQASKHAFDPFFSGREAGRGLGLGLSHCWTVAKLHGGSVNISSDAGKTKCCLCIPLEPASEPASENASVT